MKIIALEGIDASGKETQAHMLAEWLKKQGKNVLLESFPRYDEPIGAIIRQWLDEDIQLSDEAIHMLYEADRQDFTEILGWYQSIDIDGTQYIVLDRYILSNLAFGVAKGIDLHWLLQLQSKVKKPDITFIIDIHPKTSVKRRTNGRDRHEQDLGLLEKSRKAYLEVAQNLVRKGDLIFLIDGEQSPEAIHEQIKRYLTTL